MAPTTRSQSRNDEPSVPQDNEVDHELRRRGWPARTQSADEDKLGKIPVDDQCDTPPIYTIDLSLPPAERYKKVAIEFQDKIAGLTSLFDEVVSSLSPRIDPKIVGSFARIILRRLHNAEQTEELRGISAVTGVEMYLLVCFNTLLDLFMGCTSGGVRVWDGDEAKMLHFRTLDWGMDALRQVVVQYDFVERKGGPVVARTVSYVGFVGVLTGVRKDLSLSLNFRPVHNESSSKISNIRFYGNHLLVLLGLRPSICSTLRSYILPNPSKTNASMLQPAVSPPTIAEIVVTFPSIPSTAAYIILNDGRTTTVLEKDRATAVVTSSSSFIVAANHDVAHETDDLPTAPIEEPVRSETIPSQGGLNDLLGLDDLLSESMNRKGCVEKNWRKAVEEFKKSHPFAAEEDVRVSKKTVVKWICSTPVLNETTHYATIMDPIKGEVVWLGRWKEPFA